MQSNSNKAIIKNKVVSNKVYNRAYNGYYDCELSLSELKVKYDVREHLSKLHNLITVNNHKVNFSKTYNIKFRNLYEYIHFLESGLLVE